MILNWSLSKLLYIFLGFALVLNSGMLDTRTRIKQLYNYTTKTTTFHPALVVIFTVNLRLLTKDVVLFSCSYPLLVLNSWFNKSE